VRQLALQYPKSPLHSGPFLIYLTARDQCRGEAAVKEIQQDAQLQQAKALKANGGLVEIIFHSFDVTDNKSVETFTRHLKETHGDGIDFVVNNAGIALNGFGTLFVLIGTTVLTMARFQCCQSNPKLQLLQHNVCQPHFSSSS
tara:strand:+ start:8380 stop:8808 length:429 start_codon:yes stop_codon:yes gene_type:complete